MDDYNPSQLIAVCESILEDGEISGEELYRLAEWLNDHQEACHQWPGDLLVKPLQEVWADGKINKTEIRQIGRLLIRICKDWAKQQAEESLDQAVDLVTHLVPDIDLSHPQLPAIPFVVRIKSHTEKGVFYEVDLSGPTCTCPDWRSQRHRLPPCHLTRCCKHVFDAYGQLEPEAGWPGWLGAFFELAWTPHPRQDWMVFYVNGSLVLASTAPTGWANVFADEGGTYEKFGYNVLEDRWSYGMEPVGSERIAGAISPQSSKIVTKTEPKDDLTGQRFGRLAVVTRDTPIGVSEPCWLVRCDCGREEVVGDSDLRFGRVKNCSHC